MLAGQWAVSHFWVSGCRTIFPTDHPQYRPRLTVAGAMDSPMLGIAGRFFEPLGRFQDGLPWAKNGFISVFRAVRTVRTVFPTSRQEVEKKRKKEKEKVEIRKYRPNRLTVLRPATARAPAGVTK